MSRPPRAIASYPGQPRRFNPQRKRGLFLFALTAPTATLWVLLLAYLREHDLVSDPSLFKILGIPYAILILISLVGLSKLLFGRTLDELSRAWDGMAGWQRFVVGVIVVAISCLGIVLLGGFAITIMK